MKTLLISTLQIGSVAQVLAGQGADAFTIEDDRGGSGCWCVTLQDTENNKPIENMIMALFNLDEAPQLAGVC